MATYFNRNDLDARLQKTACWLAEEAIKIKDRLKYSGKIKPCKMNNFMYVSAALEAVECYIPITTSTQDGEVNCLTEAQAGALFDNISKITGICFVPKNSTYTAVTDDDNNQFEGPLTADGNVLTNALGEGIVTAILTKEIGIRTKG